jgi:hypothetical protein
MNEMLRVKMLRAAVLIALVSTPGVVHAQSWFATLMGGNEVPANASTASGTILITLQSTQLNVTESFFGLTGGVAAAAHIHCCAAAGVSALVAVPFVAFPATTAGSYTHSFDLTLTSTYNSTFLTSSGGTASGAQATLMAGLNSGLAYANIHDAVYPGGEIRGQLATVIAPEPSTVALTAAGFLALVAAARRKRATTHAI